MYQNLAPLPPPSNVKPHEKAKQQKAKCAEVEALTNLSNQNNISTQQISFAENHKNPCDYNYNPVLNSSGIHF